MRKRYLTGLLVTAGLLVSCITPRTASIFGMSFSDQAAKALIDLDCNGVRDIYQGVAVCEEKSPKVADARVKIPPTPGRVIFSDGLSKKIVDFNWRSVGELWWKQIRLDRPWVPLDIGELSSIFGEVPVAFDIAGELDGVGLIVARGAIFHRICNDRDIPCSRLVVDYECSGKVKNTGEGVLGACNRMSGSQARFRIPLKTLNYKLEANAKITIQSNRSMWNMEHRVTDSDLAAGEFKFTYPAVMTGPDLFTIAVYQFEQGVAQRYRTNILIVGFDPKWTGVDNPHWLPAEKGQIEFCTPREADLMQVTDMASFATQVTKGCLKAPISGQMCAFAWDRESSDLTYTCVKNGKEQRWGGT